MSGQKLAELASGFIDDWAAWHPSAATWLGYHRFDGHLPDWSAAALADEQRVDAAILANGALGPWWPIRFSGPDRPRGTGAGRGRNWLAAAGQLGQNGSGGVLPAAGAASYCGVLPLCGGLTVVHDAEVSA